MGTSVGQEWPDFPRRRSQHAFLAAQFAQERPLPMGVSYPCTHNAAVSTLGGIRAAAGSNPLAWALG
jgi:hypothetical protein